MGRRNSRPSRRQNGPYTDAARRAWLAVLAASAGKPVFTADRYIEDPGHLGFVLSFVDWNDPTHVLTQATAAQQVPLPAPHADFGGRLCATFASPMNYVSSRAAAAFQFMHDGTGMSLFQAFTPTDVTGLHSLACTTSTAGIRGLSYYSNATTMRSSVEKTGASVYPDSSVGAIAIGTPTYREISHGTGRSPQYDLRAKGTTVSSGAYASAAEAGDSQHTLRLASNSGPSLLFVGRWRDLILTPGVSAAQRAAIQSYYQMAYGIAP